MKETLWMGEGGRALSLQPRITLGQETEADTFTSHSWNWLFRKLRWFCGRFLIKTFNIVGASLKGSNKMSLGTNLDNLSNWNSSGNPFEWLDSRRIQALLLVELDACLNHRLSEGEKKWSQFKANWSHSGRTVSTTFNLNLHILVPVVRQRRKGVVRMSL